ncbi:hypothetical protein ABZP36_033015 [Zizania latifolia]
MASTRVWLLAAVLVACALAVRSAAQEGAPAPSAFGFFGCNPLTDKTCRPAELRAQESQEEEEGFGFRLPTIPGTGGDNEDDDDELPSFDTHLTILGH